MDQSTSGTRHMKTLIVIKKSLDHSGQTRVLPMPHLPHSPYFSYPHVMLMQAHTLLLKSYQHANGIDMMLHTVLPMWITKIWIKSSLKHS